jgi:hypothetical protein
MLSIRHFWAQAQLQTLHTNCTPLEPQGAPWPWHFADAGHAARRRRKFRRRGAAIYTPTIMCLANFIISKDKLNDVLTS